MPVFWDADGGCTGAVDADDSTAAVAEGCPVATGADGGSACTGGADWSVAVLAVGPTELFSRDGVLVAEQPAKIIAAAIASTYVSDRLIH
jgi:hypothetical protein